MRRRAAGISDSVSWYPSFPVPGSETEPNGEGEAPWERKSERIDPVAEIRLDPVKVRARGAATVLVQLRIDAAVGRPQREVPHRRLQGDISQSKVSPRPLARQVVRDTELAPPHEFPVLVLIEAIMRRQRAQLQPLFRRIDALLRGARRIEHGGFDIGGALRIAPDRGIRVAERVCEIRDRVVADLVLEHGRYLEIAQHRPRQAEGSGPVRGRLAEIVVEIVTISVLIHHDGEEASQRTRGSEGSEEVSVR